MTFRANEIVFSAFQAVADCCFDDSLDFDVWDILRVFRLNVYNINKLTSAFFDCSIDIGSEVCGATKQKRNLSPLLIFVVVVWAIIKMLWQNPFPVI